MPKSITPYGFSDSYTTMALKKLLTELPRGYGEGKMMAPPEADYIARVVAENFFLIQLDHLPVRSIDPDTLETFEGNFYSEKTGKIGPNDQPELRFENILQAIADFVASEHIQDLVEERNEKNKADNDLAFMLMKSSDPSNLRYVLWEHVPSAVQQSWLFVARKAREELEKS